MRYWSAPLGLLLVAPEVDFSATASTLACFTPLMISL